MKKRLVHDKWNYLESITGSIAALYPQGLIAYDRGRWHLILKFLYFKCITSVNLSALFYKMYYFFQKNLTLCLEYNLIIFSKRVN